jgi:hypothetical protein
VTENLAYCPRHGFAQTYRGDGFDRVSFSERLDG